MQLWDCSNYWHSQSQNHAMARMASSFGVSGILESSRILTDAYGWMFGNGTCSRTCWNIWVSQPMKKATSRLRSCLGMRSSSRACRILESSRRLVLHWTKELRAFCFGIPACNLEPETQWFGRPWPSAKSVQIWNFWVQGTVWVSLQRRPSFPGKSWNDAPVFGSCSLVSFGSKVHVKSKHVWTVTYLPHEVAEVSKDQEAIGRRCGIELVRKSIDFRFKCFAFHLVWDSMVLRFKWFEVQLPWDSIGLRFKCFCCQFIWGSSALKFESQWVWDSIALRFKWFCCHLIWNSSGLVVSWFETQVIWWSIIDFGFKGFEIQVCDLRFKWNEI